MSLRQAEPSLDRSAAGGYNPWLIAVIISIATFMEVLDSSIANVSLRNIAGSLATDADSSTWVLTSYLIASAIILPISGWLSSVVGRKRFYMASVGIFTFASVLCALAPSLGWLIVFRLLQGIGGGGLAPSEQSMLADTFPPEKRGQAFAVYGIAVVVAPTLGPSLGGWITDNFSWHWIFLINLPMGLLSLTLVHLFVAEPMVLKEERQRRLSDGLKVDIVGFALVALWLGCLEVMLDRGQREDWFQSPLIVGFGVVSLVSLLILVPWELSRSDPIFDVRLLMRRQFASSCLLMMAIGAILFSSTQLLPQLLQESYGYTATWAGLALMPGGLALLIMMPVAGWLTGWIASRYLVMCGMILVTLGMWHLTTLSLDAGFMWFAWARLYTMIGLPFLFLPVSTSSYIGLPPEKTGEASSLINVSRNLGGSIGISLMTTLLAQREQFHQSRIVESLSTTRSGYQVWLRSATEQLIAQGTALSQVQAKVSALLALMIQGQVTVLAYIDVFAALALVAMAMIPVGLLLRGEVKRNS